MKKEIDQGDLSSLLVSLEQDVLAYFDRAEEALKNIPRPDSRPDRWNLPDRDHFWKELPEQLREEAEGLVKRLLDLAGPIADAVRNALLTSEADQRDVMTGTKAMRAAILLRHFHSWTADVLHDEGTVLGLQPAGQSDDKPSAPEIARRSFASWKVKIHDIIDLVSTASGRGIVGRDVFSIAPARYRPSTAFIMMSMDTELIDVVDTVKQVFKQFDIRAVRADDIEHEDLKSLVKLRPLSSSSVT